MSENLTFVVEDGTGLDTSTSFVSVAYATSYATIHGKESWLSLTDSQKEVTLVLASDYVNSQYNWRGEPVNPLQALALPRCGFSIPSGASSTGIPSCVKKAVSELATRCFTTEGGSVTFVQLIDDIEMAGSIKSYKNKLDTLEEQVTYASPSDLKDVRPYPSIDAMIEAWLLKRAEKDIWGSITTPVILTGVTTSEVARQDNNSERFTGFEKNSFFGGEDEHP